jgi:hypothetical protein
VLRSRCFGYSGKLLLAVGSGGFDAACGGFSPANAQKWVILERKIATILTGQARTAIKNIANFKLTGLSTSAPNR